MSYEKAVKGATKIKLAPPKSKYIQPLLDGTRAGESAVADIFRTLQLRLRDSTWTIAFKALIVVHLLVREGAPNATLEFLAASPRSFMGVNTYTDVQTQGRNIRHYSDYLLQRVKAYSKTNCDYVRDGEGRVRRLTVDKGLLRETETVQEQIRACIKCDLLTEDPDNEICLTAFRLATMDLLALFRVMNEGTINVLEHYFEMSRPDAERALSIYRTFVKLTEQVVKYLAVARQFQHATRLEIPKIKHAPTGLTQALEEYLQDQEFETNRRQYLAAKDGKIGSGSAASAAKTSAISTSNRAAGQKVSASQSSQSAVAAAKPSGPPADLMDFFESIEKNQQPMAHEQTGYQQASFMPQFQQPQHAATPQQPPQTVYSPVPTFAQQQYAFDNFQPQQQQQQQQQQSQLIAQSTNPFGQYHQPQQFLQPQQFQQQTTQVPTQLQPQYTGAGFGGYGPQPEQLMVAYSASQPISLQPTSNPFRQPTEGQNFGGSPSLPQLPSMATGRNPFARDLTYPGSNGTPIQQTGYGESFFSPPQQQQQPSIPQALQPQATGTNPFARGVPSQNTPQTASSPQVGTLGAMVSQATGSTNPFRQSAFVNQQTGQGWQQTQQGTMGGLESLQTVEVFPRPGQTPAQTHWG